MLYGSSANGQLKNKCGNMDKFGGMEQVAQIQTFGKGIWKWEGKLNVERSLGAIQTETSA